MLGMEEKEKSKNLKVLFNEFVERETPKDARGQPGPETPGEGRVFRAWEKWPDNPKNRGAAAGIFTAVAVTRDGASRGVRFCYGARTESGPAARAGGGKHGRQRRLCAGQALRPLRHNNMATLCG